MITIENKLKIIKKIRNYNLKVLRKKQAESDEVFKINELVKRKKCNSIFNASLNTFPIENLTTGTYYLKNEAINRDNEVIHTQNDSFIKLIKT